MNNHGSYLVFMQLFCKLSAQFQNACIFLSGLYQDKQKHNQPPINIRNHNGFKVMVFHCKQLFTNKHLHQKPLKERLQEKKIVLKLKRKKIRHVTKSTSELKMPFWHPSQLTFDSMPYVIFYISSFLNYTNHILLLPSTGFCTTPTMVSLCKGNAPQSALCFLFVT